MMSRDDYLDAITDRDERYRALLARFMEAQRSEAMWRLEHKRLSDDNKGFRRQLATMAVEDHRAKEEALAGKERQIAALRVKIGELDPETLEVWYGPDWQAKHVAVESFRANVFQVVERHYEEIHGAAVEAEKAARAASDDDRWGGLVLLRTCLESLHRHVEHARQFFPQEAPSE